MPKRRNRACKYHVAQLRPVLEGLALRKIEKKVTRPDNKRNTFRFATVNLYTT